VQDQGHPCRSSAVRPASTELKPPAPTTLSPSSSTIDRPALVRRTAHQERRLIGISIDNFGRFEDGAILDEVQRCPPLFSYLQTLVDEDRRNGLFILTGSRQFGLLSSVTQTLAGRIAMVSLLPFSLTELQAADQAPATLEALLFQGLYPPIYDRGLDAAVWYRNYVLAYVERDVRQMVRETVAKDGRSRFWARSQGPELPFRRPPGDGGEETWHRKGSPGGDPVYTCRRPGGKMEIPGNCRRCTSVVDTGQYGTPRRCQAHSPTAERPSPRERPSAPRADAPWR